MNNFREVKKSKLLHDEAFTYVICSDDRTNITPAYPALTYFYDVILVDFLNYMMNIELMLSVLGQLVAFQQQLKTIIFLLVKVFQIMVTFVVIKYCQRMM